MPLQLPRFLAVTAMVGPAGAVSRDGAPVFSILNADETTPELIALPEPIVPPGGFFLCGHCHHVVTPSQQQIDTWENAPAGSQARLKCPRCHKWDVSWREESKRKPKPAPAPVSQDQAAQFFQELKASLN